jgi:hypothetical protein
VKDLRRPIRPLPTPPDAAKASFHVGCEFPRAIAWFGLKSFWGHLWHFAASAIATEDIDSRDWMRAGEADELTAAAAAAMGAMNAGRTLTEALGDDLWIDYVSDTGDDVSVSRAVARLVFGRYEVDDPESPEGALLLPRGKLLVFGGDTAYPVATELEIHNRVIVPYEHVLSEVDDGEPRCLIAIPGNHDWYGGLDGFGRMFRAPTEGDDEEAEPLPEPSIDRLGQIGHFARWARAFATSTKVEKRHALRLRGYRAVQRSSYWALHLAPRLQLWGVDRQLRRVDSTQRAYFRRVRRAAPDHGVIACLPDPVRAFLTPNAPGEGILEALQVSFARDRLFTLAGDSHHYVRADIDGGLHVTAGGGGAFLHPARMARGCVDPPAAEFPGPRASLALTLQIPLRVANGRAGSMVHLVFGAAYALGLVVQASPVTWALVVSAATTALAAAIGRRRGYVPAVAGLSIATGLAIGFMPFAIDRAAAPLLARVGLEPGSLAAELVGLVPAVYAATLVAGTFLMLLALLGIRHDAFGALAHPGYKHFVRLRVRSDGSAVDAWVLGQIDPLAIAEPVVLVDRFTWRNPGA